MPKLPFDATPDEMRRHIIQLQDRKLVDITQYNDGDRRHPIYLSDDVLQWTDLQVRKYYIHKLPKSIIKEYDDILEKEKKILEEIAEDPTKKEARPKFTDDEYENRILEVRFKRLPEDEEKYQINEILEELEYRQLAYDGIHNPPLSDDAFQRFEELDKKFSADDYSKQKETIAELEKKLRKQKERMDEFGTGRKKPNLLQKAWNRVHKWIYKKESKVVRDFNKQEELRKKHAEIEVRIEAAKADMELIEKKHANFNYSENIMKREERILLQAKNIVLKEITKSANDAGKPVPTLKEQELNANAKSVIKSEAFKQTVNELDAGSHEVNADTFFTRFMHNVEENRAKKEQESSKSNTVTVDNATIKHENKVTQENLTNSQPGLHA